LAQSRFLHCPNKNLLATLTLAKKNPVVSSLRRLPLTRKERKRSKAEKLGASLLEADIIANYLDCCRVSPTTKVCAYLDATPRRRPSIVRVGAAADDLVDWQVAYFPRQPAHYVHEEEEQTGREDKKGNRSRALLRS
jgi:hypothetical protein